MNILQLIQNCQVEWKSLGEVLVRTKGTKITAGQMKELHQENAPIKIFAGGKTFAMVNYDDIPEKDINRNPSIIVKSRGIIEFEYYDKPFSHKNEMWSYHSQNSEIDIKFVYYFLKQNEPYFQNIGSRMQMPQIATPDTDKFKIPIPPLEIQEKIVKILDKLTKLTAELTAELTARKKQYNYYRDQLLSFEDGEVEWKTLGEVCRFINGRAYKQPELLESGKYPVLRVGNFFTNGNWYFSNLELEDDKYCDAGDLLYAWSASFGPKIWDGNKVIYHYHIWKVVPNTDLILKKYLFYVLAWDTESIKTEHGTGSTMMHVGKGAIEKRLVPVPSLEEQTRIVAILDKFDALTESLTEGLPREIELRQKQYEYYRELLLDFNMES